MSVEEIAETAAVDDSPTNKEAGFLIGKALAGLTGKLWALPRRDELALYLMRNGDAIDIGALTLTVRHPHYEWEGTLKYTGKFYERNGLKAPQPVNVKGTPDQIAGKIIELLGSYL